MAKWFSLTHVTTDMMMADDKTKMLDRAKCLERSRSTTASDELSVTRGTMNSTEFIQEGENV